MFAMGPFESGRVFVGQDLDTFNMYLIEDRYQVTVWNCVVWSHVIFRVVDILAGKHHTILRTWNEVTVYLRAIKDHRQKYA